MLTIRRAKLSDANGMAEIAKEGLKRGVWKYTYINSYPKSKLEKLKKTLQSKSKPCIFFVAVEDGKVVAMSNYEFRKTGRTRHKMEMGWSVHPDHMGQGIATKLVEFVLNYAKKKGFKKAEAEVAVKNKASVRVAQKCGFKIEGTKEKGLLTDEGKLIHLHVVGKVL